MTLNEFKAWLKGFERSFIGGRPSLEEWQEIKKEINGITAYLSNSGSSSPSFPSPRTKPVVSPVWYDEPLSPRSPVHHASNLSQNQE